MDSFAACNLGVLLKCRWNSVVRSDSNNVPFSGRWKSFKSFPILCGPLCPLSTYSNQYKWQCVILAGRERELKNALICMKTKVKRLAERATWTHRPSPLILSRLLCDIPSLVEVTESFCACACVCVCVWVHIVVWLCICALWSDRLKSETFYLPHTVPSSQTDTSL